MEIDIVEVSQIIEVVERGPQGVAGFADLLDAPLDGGHYLRKDGLWHEVSPNQGLKSGYSGGTLPIISRAGTNSINIAGGATYTYRDLSGVPPVEWIEKTFIGLSNYTLTTPISAVTAYIYLDLRTMTVFDSPATPAAKLGYHAYLGNVDFADGDIDTNPYIETSYSSLDTSTNLTFARGDYNLFGCRYYGTTGLALGHTVGRGLRIGVNTVNDLESPDIIDTAEDSIKFVIRAYKDVADNFIIDNHPTDVDPTKWANNGVLTVVNSTKWTVQYVYHFYGSDVAVVYYGTGIYNSLEAAEAAIVNPPAGIHQITKEASIRAALVIKGDATDLTDIAQAKFLVF